MQGRLNLNPLSHLDPIGSMLLLFAGFGWGKPVQINPRNFSRKISMSAADAIVSFAGPFMNFLLAFIFLIIYYLLRTFNILGGLSSNMAGIIITMVLLASTINVGLGVFNLLPLPPLDGSKILMHFLPYNAKRWFENNERIFYYVFIFLFITGASSYIIGPIIRGVYTGLSSLVKSIFRLMGLL